VNFQCPWLPGDRPSRSPWNSENGIKTFQIESVMQAAAPGVFTLGGPGQGVIQNLPILTKSPCRGPKEPPKPAGTPRVISRDLSPAVSAK